ncbi:MAG: hypothetical protein J6A61_05960 [Clostridia bacterium]|nr:hypothetical protein [Clostridia bacterium]
MKQMEGVLTYHEAGTYIRQVKMMLKRVKALEHFIEINTKTHEQLLRIAKTFGKKNALLSFSEYRDTDYDAAYDEYCEELETSLHRAKYLYEKTVDAWSRVPDEWVRNTLWYYYAEGHNIEDTAEHMLFSASSVARYKKIGLAQMAEQMFGVLIQV